MLAEIWQLEIVLTYYPHVLLFEELRICLKPFDAASFLPHLLVDCRAGLNYEKIP